MPSYEEVLTLAQHLPPDDQVRLLQALTTLVYSSVEVEDSDEVISAEELSESEMAWQDYQAGHDLGITSEALKLKLFGR